MVVVQKLELLERFAALDLTKHVSEGRSQANRIHFVKNNAHLRAADRVEKLQVRWPSGLRQEFADLAADQAWIFVEGSPRAHRANN